ncbi:hypothetical protein [Mycobacterium sp. D16R24]|nr:hypothetical protein [Mycobacterium sp. D16R24]
MLFREHVRGGCDYGKAPHLYTGQARSAAERLENGFLDEQSIPKFGV